MHSKGLLEVSYRLQSIGPHFISAETPSQFGLQFAGSHLSPLHVEGSHLPPLQVDESHFITEQLATLQEAIFESDLLQHLLIGGQVEIFCDSIESAFLLF